MSWLLSRPHLKAAILDDVQLRGRQSRLPLLDEDLSCVDAPDPGVLNHLDLGGLVQALKQQQLGQRGLQSGQTEV